MTRLIIVLALILALLGVLIWIAKKIGSAGSEPSVTRSIARASFGPLGSLLFDESVERHILR